MIKQSFLIMLFCLLLVLSLQCSCCLTQEVEEQPGQQAYKSLFVDKNKLEPELALKLLEESTTYHITPNIDVWRLINYSKGSKCTKDILNSIQKDKLNIQDNYPALLPYIDGQLERLCSYNNVIKRYQNDDPKRWSVMNGLFGKVKKFEKIFKNPKKDNLDSSFQLNEAMQDIYEDYKKGTQSGGELYEHRGDAAISTYNDLHQIIAGSHIFKDEVSPSIDWALKNSGEDYGGLEDAVNRNHYYNQAVQTNFGPSMSNAFADAYYDPGNKYWQGYSELQYLNNW